MPDPKTPSKSKAEAVEAAPVEPVEEEPKGTGEIVTFSYDRDTVLDGEVLKDNPDGTKDLRCRNVSTSKFTTTVSEAPGTKLFLNVRKGTHINDVGTFYPKEVKK